MWVDRGHLYLHNSIFMMTIKFVMTIKVNQKKKEGSKCSPREHVLEQEHLNH